MYIINVCGNLCSGKTTLCEKISNYFGMQYVHAHVDEALIESFFSNPNEYFLQQQLTILLDKAMKIHSCVKGNTDMVIDRSVYEDVEIFAKYFLDNRKTFKIDSDTEKLYLSVANKVLANIPPPNIAIYCYSLPSVCEKRAAVRGRNYESFYPKNHFYALHELYERKIVNVECNSLLKLDCIKNDLTDEKIVSEILTDLQIYMQNPTTKSRHSYSFEIIRN